ncbi:MAG TPA: hypothetical protein VF222_12880 [Nitrososphaeraceae archaeon]
MGTSLILQKYREMMMLAAAAATIVHTVRHTIKKLPKCMMLLLKN